MSQNGKSEGYYSCDKASFTRVHVAGCGGRANRFFGAIELFVLGGPKWNRRIKICLGEEFFRTACPVAGKDFLVFVQVQKVGPFGCPS